MLILGRGLKGQNLWPWPCDCKSLALALEGRPWHKSSSTIISTNASIFPAKRNEFPRRNFVNFKSAQKLEVLLYIKSFNEGKKLLTDECYVCVLGAL